MGSILMTKAVCWVTPSKVMVVRSFEVVAAYVLQVRSKCLPIRRKSSFQVTVFDVPSHWTDILGTGAIISAVLGEPALRISFDDISLSNYRIIFKISY